MSRTQENEDSVDKQSITITQKNALLEKIVLGEIKGKNLSIHAYDGIVWKIRTGVPTLMFGGWAILLKGVMEKPQVPPERYAALALGLLLFSIGFACGAWIVDRNYVQRKFRVILALDRLSGVGVAFSKHFSMKIGYLNET